MQKTCEYPDMSGPYCNPSARDLLKRMNDEKADKQNPLWKGLEKFKDLDN